MFTVLPVFDAVTVLAVFHVIGVDATRPLCLLMSLGSTLAAGRQSRYCCSDPIAGSQIRDPRVWCAYHVLSVFHVFPVFHVFTVEAQELMLASVRGAAVEMRSRLPSEP